MKISFASSALIFSFFALASYACSSSSSTGGDTDAGTSSLSQDSGSSTAPDSGGSQQSACGTGTFSCNGSSGETTCQIATQYCMDSLGCISYDGLATGGDPCPDCTNPPGECGVGKTSSCAGNDQTGVTITCN